MSTRCGWRVLVDGPGPELTGVAVLRDGSVWAVGADDVASGFVFWRRGALRKTASPIYALAVDGASASDVWAVGASGPTSRAVALAEHWDGRHWHVTSLDGRPGEYLRAVAAVSPRDVWAVGADDRGGPMIERWNGHEWTRFAAGPVHGLLHGMQALSDGTAWAVGTQGMQTLGPQSERPLVERWTGSRWNLVPTPGVEWVNVNLLGVDVISTSNVFAAGSADLGGGRVPVVLHWDGRGWTALPTAGLPTDDVSLTAVVASAANDVWVTGSSGGNPERPLLAHWNGRRWNQATDQPSSGVLIDLTADSATNVWAVGGSQTGRSSKTLLEHFSCR
jgi:hypothetical protein